MIYELIQKVINEEHDPNFYQSYNSLNEIDKTNIERIIFQNKLSSLFLKFIYENNLISKLDKNFYKKLKAQSSRFQAHSLQIIKEVHLINRLFINAGLNPIYLKGVAIQKEYKDISLRPMVDIDILFKKEEIWAVDIFNYVKDDDVQRRFFEHCITYKGKALSMLWEE